MSSKDTIDEVGYVNRQFNDNEDLFGKVVENEEQAYDLYIEHARKFGFDVRKGQRRHGINHILRQINFLCSKEGFRVDSDDHGEKKINRLETRTGCKASIRFTIDDDKWTVTYFNGEHNHEFVESQEKQFLKINRKITDSHAVVLKTMVDAGIRTTNSYSYLVEDAGGFENVGFTKRDCYNFVNIQKLNLIEAGDAQSLINLFKSKQVEDPMSFYSVQVDQESRMTNFSGEMVNRGATMIVLGMLSFLTQRIELTDEKIPSFTWLFETFLESMGNRQPKCIMIDQCQAIGRACKMVFPETQHRLCKWHISKNAANNIGHYYANPEFKKCLNNCLYFSYTEVELQTNWQTMIEKFKDYEVDKNKWLIKLYHIRKEWCSALVRILSQR